jgi:homoserine O-acetyltransferase
MGAQQTYEWAVRYPIVVERIAPLAGTAKITDHCWLFADTLAEAIRSDPAWNGGWYTDAAEVHRGLRRMAGLMAVGATSPTFYNTQFWRSIGFSSALDFRTAFFGGFFLPMDPNALLATIWKWQHGGVTAGRGGELKSVLGSITANTLVLPVRSDKMFTVGDCEAEQKLIPNSQMTIIESDCGHLGIFGLDSSYAVHIDKALARLLAQPTRP